MNFSKITALALAATLSLASVGADAQQGHRDGRDRDQGPRASQHHEAWRGQAMQARHDRYDRYDRNGRHDRHDRYDRRDTRYGAAASRGIGPRHQFHRGERLPNEWRGRQHYVNDWRAYQLAAPPQGQQWVQVGSDFALVALATGVITSLIMNN